MIRWLNKLQSLLTRQPRSQITDLFYPRVRILFDKSATDLDGAGFTGLCFEKGKDQIAVRMECEKSNRLTVLCTADEAKTALDSMKLTDTLDAFDALVNSRIRTALEPING